jgi:hypothetical protein
VHLGVAIALVAAASAHAASPSPYSPPSRPGVDPATFASDYVRFLGAIGTAAQESPEVPAEPPLRCYVLARCRQR